jgi:hypothetical protein
LVEVLLGVFIAGEDVEVVTVNLDVSSNSKVCGCNEFLVLVNVLVLPSLKELTLNNT